MISDFLPLLFPLIATGILSGFVAGLLGVGGGIIIAPIIAYLLTSHGLHTHMPMHVAIGSSLAVIVPTSIISARTHTRLSNVDFDVVRRLGPVVFLGAMGGAVVASWLDNHSLKIIFGLLALMMSILFLIKMVEIRTDLPSFWPRSVLGGAIGLISTLVGIGGGSLTVPTLSACGWSIRRAVGTSALMGIVIAVPGMVSYMIVGAGRVTDLPFSTGFIWWPAVIIISIAAYFTAPLGAFLSVRLPQSYLRMTFGIFLMIVGSRLIYKGYDGGGLSFVFG